MAVYGPDGRRLMGLMVDDWSDKSNGRGMGAMGEGWERWSRGGRDGRAIRGPRL